MAIGIRRSSGRGNAARRVRVRSMIHRVPARQKAVHSRIRVAPLALVGNPAKEGVAETDDPGDWLHNPVEVLKRIQQPANDLELFHAVLFAEILPFDDGQLTNSLCGAVHAVTAVALLVSIIDHFEETPELLAIATALGLPRFSELVADAINDSISELQKHSADVARPLATVTQQALEPFKRIIPCT